MLPVTVPRTLTVFWVLDCQATNRVAVGPETGDGCVKCGGGEGKLLGVSLAELGAGIRDLPAGVVSEALRGV